MKSPSVSFVIPSYNYGHMIERCIDSILAQGCEDWELIISDDGSEDNTLSILKNYTDPRISIYVNQTQLGIYGNIEAGISHSSGAFLKILMADDWLHPDYLQVVLEYFDRYPSIGLCAVRAEVVDAAGRTLHIRNEPEPQKAYYNAEAMLWWTTHKINPVGNPSHVIFRREAFEAVGRFDLSIEYCTELDLWIRMLEQWDCAFVPRVLCYETLHSNNATRTYTYDARHLTTVEQMYAKLFQTHAYFRGHWLRQQTIWVRGWQEYWLVSIRHLLEGQTSEFRVLMNILWRRSLVFLWLPLLFWRFGQVVSQKGTSKLRSRWAS